VRLAYQKAGVMPVRTHHTRLLQTGLLLVGAGVGISILPECFKSIRVRGVVYKKLLVEPPPSELVAAWQRDNPSPLLRRFILALDSRDGKKHRTISKRDLRTGR